MRLSHIAVACGVIVSAATAVPASAEDGKALPGSACQRQFDHVNAPMARTAGTLLALHDSAVKVFCPVTKDIEAGRIKRAEVLVDDNHALADVRCELFSLRQDGSVLQSTLRATSGNPATPVTLTFGAHSANAKGRYALTCELPPGTGNGAVAASTILGYSVVEE